MTHHFDFIVIGKGLIGSAAARYLSEHQQRVAIIGPDEPPNWASHQGVFASHYDQGRITRELADDLVWGTLAKRSIEQYASLEQCSGIKFHFPVGTLQVGPVASGGYIAKTDAVGQALDTAYQTYTAETLPAVHPALHFPAGYRCLLERGGAGYVNPRELVKAQLTVTTQQGGTVISDTVTRVNRKGERVHILTETGQAFQASRVLIAAGAYTNFLLDHPLDLVKTPRTVLLGRVSGPELERLQNLPAIIFYDGVPQPDLKTIYALPPIQYPDGHTYIKIGGRMIDPPPLQTADDMRAWFHSNGDNREIAALKEVLYAIIPGLKADTHLQRPCVITLTAHERPYIDTLDDGHIFVATGGCGSAAKSSNEIGRVAGRLVERGQWDYDLGAEDFRAIY